MNELERSLKETEEGKEERIIAYAYFLINWKYGSIKELAEKLEVSERLIRWYVEKYWYLGTKPKYERKKGAYRSFLTLLKRADKEFKEIIEKLSVEKGLDKEKVIEIFKEAMKENRRYK